MNTAGCHCVIVALTNMSKNDKNIDKIVIKGARTHNLKDITVEMLQKALNWKDKLNGRIVDKIEQLRPSKIIILSPMQTGDLVEDALDDRAKESTGVAVRALGPGEE